MAALPAYDIRAEQAARLRDFIAQLAIYGYLPAPAPDHWPVFELESRERLSRIWQLCRSITSNEQMPMNLDACTSIIRALNEAPLPYPAAPQTAARDAALSRGAHPYVLQPVAVIGPDGRDSGRTEWQRVIRA